MATSEIQIITASQIITFDKDSDTDSGILRIEVDTRSDGLNGGKSSFQPGDSVGLLLFRSPNVSIIHGPIVTHGTISEEGTHALEQIGFLVYAGESSQTMSHPICTPSLSWLGTSLGPIIVNNCAVVELVNPPDWNPGSPDVDLEIGILKYEGTSTAQGYRLRNTALPGQDPPYQIGVYVFGMANAT